MKSSKLLSGFLNGFQSLHLSINGQKLKFGQALTSVTPKKIPTIVLSQYYGWYLIKCNRLYVKVKSWKKEMMKLQHELSSFCKYVCKQLSRLNQFPKIFWEISISVSISI